MNPDCRTWNLACLEGSAKGYARGTVSVLRVGAWARRALRVGASAEEVRAVLTPYDLVLTPELSIKARDDDPGQ
jgi:hypothetical protein